MIDLAASLWSVPAGEHLATARRLQRAGLRRIHWDTTDGRFAAAGGFDPAEAGALTATTGLRAEAHLMVEEPLRHVDRWTEFSDLVFVHAESTGWRQALDRIEKRGAAPGVAISAGTPVETIPTDLAVLCMSITPGAAGSAFDARVMETVADLREKSSSPRLIGVDGGVQRRHAELLARAGADRVVVGTDLVFGGEERWGDILDGG